MKLHVKNIVHKKRLVILGIVVLFSALLVAIGVSSQQRKQPTVNEPGPVITISTDNPEESLPTQIGYVWKGTASEPKKVQIPALSIDAFIQKVGVDQNKQIAVPNNIHIAGWFVDSVSPGEQGLSIIDGHVNGRNSDNGVFSRLKELKTGEEVTITFGDESVKKFTVYSSQSLPTESAADVLFSQVPTIERQLNLVTCTGTYNAATSTYSERWITVLQAI